MIVRCPSCSTSYRHARAGGSAAPQARCSRCDALFVAAPAPRQYLVVDAARVGLGAAVAPEASFEMAPALTLAVAAHEAAGGLPLPVPSIGLDEAPPAPRAEADGTLSWDGPVDDRPAASERPTAPDSGRTEGRRVIAGAAAPLRDLGLPPGMIADAPGDDPFAPTPRAPGNEAATVVIERPRHAAPRRAGARSRPVLEGLIAIVCGAAGAAGLRYAVPTFRSLDLGDPTWNAWLREPEPLHWGALGGVLGLLVAWALVRWMARDR